MVRTRGEIETILRDTICRICTDRKTDGSCGLEQPDTCALFRLMPQVVDAVEFTNSDNITDYIDALRAKVCAVCVSQDAAGDCERRNDVACALDAYLILVVDAIEEATGKVFDRSGLMKDGLTQVAGLPYGNALA